MTFVFGFNTQPTIPPFRISFQACLASLQTVVLILFSFLNRSCQASCVFYKGIGICLNRRTERWWEDALSYSAHRRNKHSTRKEKVYDKWAILTINTFSTVHPLPLILMSHTYTQPCTWKMAQWLMTVCENTEAATPQKDGQLKHKEEVLKKELAHWGRPAAVSMLGHSPALLGRGGSYLIKQFNLL